MSKNYAFSENNHCPQPSAKVGWKRENPSRTLAAAHFFFDDGHRVGLGHILLSTQISQRDRCFFFKLKRHQSHVDQNSFGKKQSQTWETTKKANFWTIKPSSNYHQFSLIFYWSPGYHWPTSPVLLLIWTLLYIDSSIKPLIQAPSRG